MAGKLDSYQMKAVSTAHSSVVTAGAGSGKTTVLAERFLHLIEEGRAEVDAILTLTFTRKAAAEMYERIYRRIGERLGELERLGDSTGRGGLEYREELEDREAREGRLRSAIQDFSSARISTIDSFCSQVVRGGCGRFGIPGDFVQDEHAVGKVIEETALSFLLARIDSDDLGAYIRDHGFSRVLYGLFIPLAKEEFHLAGYLGFDKMYERQREHLEQAVKRGADTLERSRRAFLDIPADGAWYKRISSHLMSLPDFTEAAKEGPETLAEALQSLVLDKKSGNTKKEDVLAAKEIVTGMQESAAEAGAALDILLRDEYARMYELLKEYEEEIRRKRRSAGVLTFRDVVEMTVVLLTEDPDLRRYYKELFRHIMIDEFQDNNDLQRRLLFLLAEKTDVVTKEGVPAAEDLEPGKLFFVGDEKQSIYRFRGADVSVFTGLQSEIGKAGGDALSLDFNYRSHPKLIDFFNDFFAGFLADPVHREDYQAAHSPLRAFRDGGRIAPQIRLFFKPYEKERGEGLLDSIDAEAWFVATRIRSLVEEQRIPVRDGERERPCRYDDIALLMRSTGNQLRYERYFRRLRIPYTVQSTRSLFMEAPVNDMYLALQLLVYPEDDAAYAGLLRSPLVQLSDETVFSLLLDRKEREDYGEPFAHLGDEESFSSEEDRASYRKAKEIFLRLEELKKAAPPSELLRFLWYEAGYRYILLRRPDYHVYLEFYETLTELARTTERRGESLASFLDYLRRNLGENEKTEELELPPSGETGVKIMTIHKSKGLEFPVVFLVDTGNTGAGSKGGGLYVRDEELGIALKWNGGAKGYFDARFEEFDTKRHRAELRRLLYVACTRAQDHLFISGIHHSHNRNMQKSGAEALLNISLDAFGWNRDPDEVDLDALSIDAEQIPDYSEEDVDAAAAGVHGRSLARMDLRYDACSEITFPSLRKLFSPVELNRLFQHGREGQAPEAKGIVSEAPEASKAPGEEGEYLPALDADPLLQGEEDVTAFGSLCHHLIEQRLKSDNPEEVRAEQLMPGKFLDRSPEQRRLIESTAEELADQFFAHPLGREALEGDFESELSFMLRVDSSDEEARMSFVKGQIDLLIAGKEEVKVVDFKTDRYLRPREHAGQLAFYRKAAEELYGLPVACYLVYLRGMRAVRVDARVDLAGLCRAGRRELG